ncbi:hypothetical protein [Mycolicibacterium peregrinum]|uniref:Uncharacterized protein n=1 Tax=Mycolicibacterium peregrinum TaxID=43304 RepID=A0A4Z0HMH4_MYCPR|nr:hypothetical protein [Mycolicibacterium peregrinum]TGB37913.1 hypothetical protein EJD98_25525 [Mycolicibacterium peregrinum]TGB38068.1 hypothetical protein EJD94_25040 [Mycolicibacterium peregrinum]
MTTTFEEFVAEHRAALQREAEASRKRLFLFALESVDTDGCPRVSGYTVETLIGQGLIEALPGDNLGRYQLTAEGRIALQANPVEEPASDELALFGALS